MKINKMSHVTLNQIYCITFTAQIYKKQNMAVPQEVKDRLTNALEYPSFFMNRFLKQNKDEMSRRLSTINRMLVAKSMRGANRPGANQKKYAKQAKSIGDNYAELVSEDPQSEFCEADFVRPSFLQYLICAFCYEVWCIFVPIL